MELEDTLSEVTQTTNVNVHSYLLILDPNVWMYLTWVLFRNQESK